MSKPWTPNRPTVELRSSRIRREPPPERKIQQAALPDDDSEREAWVVVAGILAFALAITFLIFWVSDYTSGSRQPQPITITDAS